MGTDEIRTREDFIEFVYSLRDTYRNGSSLQNDTTESYLSALAGWVEDMDGAYLNWNKELPKDINWSVIAQILDAATIYS
jgi:hypothetical protein